MSLRVLDAWLDEGDAGDGDFAAHVLRLATTGGLARSGRYLLDVPALTQPYACRSLECTPGRRAARTRSCCADVAVSLSARERRAIERTLPRLKEFLARRDPRWAGAMSAPAIEADGSLARPKGRCMFAVEGAAGLRCGLQQAERAWGLRVGALKPLPCRLFPVIVVDLGEGRRLLTAVARRTSALVGTYPAARFPCLRSDPARPRLYREMKATLSALLGTRTADVIARALKRHAAPQ